MVSISIQSTVDELSAHVAKAQKTDIASKLKILFMTAVSIPVSELQAPSALGGLSASRARSSARAARVANKQQRFQFAAWYVEAWLQNLFQSHSACRIRYW